VGAGGAGVMGVEVGGGMGVVDGVGAVVSGGGVGVVYGVGASDMLVLPFSLNKTAMTLPSIIVGSRRFGGRKTTELLKGFCFNNNCHLSG